MTDTSAVPCRLQLQVNGKDEDYLLIEISAADGRFAGATELYSGDLVIEKLATGLRGFPRSSDDRRVIALGSTDPRVADGAVEISCHCLDLSGHAVLQIELLDKSHAPGLEERRVRVHLPVEASAVDRFVEQLTNWDPAPGDTVSLPGAT